MSLVALRTVHAHSPLPPEWSKSCGNYVCGKAGCVVIPRPDGYWLVGGRDARVQNDFTHYPSYLQAMAAALGYKLRNHSGAGFWTWVHDDQRGFTRELTGYNTPDAAAFAACMHYSICTWGGGKK